MRASLPSAPCHPSDSHAWFRRWRQVVGSSPCYRSFDIVTSGLHPDADLIIEVGVCCVREGRLEDRHSLLLDWTQEPSVDLAWLQSRLEFTAQQVEWRNGARTAQHYPLRLDDLRRDGISPRLALHAFLRVLHEALPHRAECLVAHNGWSFDLPILERQARYWLGVDVHIDPDFFFDTALMEKAVQIHAFPEPGEPWPDFWDRIAFARVPGAHWSLHDHCLPKYGLAGRYPQRNHAGRADEEAYAAHLLMEEFRRLGSVSRSAGPTLPRPGV